MTLAVSSFVKLILVLETLKLFTYHRGSIKTLFVHVLKFDFFIPELILVLDLKQYTPYEGQYLYF